MDLSGIPVTPTPQVLAPQDINLTLSEETARTSSANKASLHLTISPDDTENDDDDELGTPLGMDDGADVFGNEEAFATHRFIGPSDPCDASSTPALHGLRSLCLSTKPPSFTSAVASRIFNASQSKSRTSSIDSQKSGDAGVRHQSMDSCALNAYSVTFTDAAMGFIGVLSSDSPDNEVFQVENVERNSLAFRAGVVVGDVICSINNQEIESHMTEEQMHELLTESSLPRTIVFMRKHPILPHRPQSKSTGFLDRRPVLSGKLSSVLNYGSSMLGSALKRKKSIVHKNVVCEGCGVDTISGVLWTCSVCSNVNLCSDCYGAGIHGMEGTEAMQTLKEAIVQYKLLKRCKLFDAEFLLCLRRDICMGRPDKFEYMGNWIADIVNGTAASKITVRGIEIPRLAPTSRQRFVSRLMPLVSNRTDIDVNIEWIPDETETELQASDDTITEDHTRYSGVVSNREDKLEKLRIWISDKNSRQASPF